MILQDRVAKAEARKSLIKSEQVQSGERFSWKIGWNKDLKNYIEENEVELTTRKKQLSITEALNLHYLLDKFKNTKLLNYIRNNPKKSKAIKTALDDSITESTRLLNNLYENMQNNFEYGLEPKTEQEQDIVNRCKGEKSLDEFVRCAYTKYAKGGKITTWKNKYNKKYGYKPNKAHNLSAISKDTGISKKGLQQIYNKGVGAYKTNPSSVRPNVKSKEQWAMARVYSAVMGGKASKIDKKELKMERGGEVYKYKFKKGDTFELDTSIRIGGKKERITITKLEQNPDMLPTYWMGDEKQKRSSKFDGWIAREEFEENVESGKWKKL